MIEITPDHPEIRKVERDGFIARRKKVFECPRCGEDVFEGEEVFIRSYRRGKRRESGYICGECFREIIGEMSLEELAMETGTDFMTAERYME